MTRFNTFLLKYLCKGIMIGWGFLALLLVTNLGGIGSLIFSSSNTLLAICLLGVGFAITFGSCAMGVGVTKYLPEADDAQSKV